MKENVKREPTDMEENESNIKNQSGLGIIEPGLIAGHAVAADEFDHSVGSGGVQAVVIRHYLLTFCVGEHLVSAQSMAVGYSYILSSFTSHCIQTRLRLRISNLNR